MPSYPKKPCMYIGCNQLISHDKRYCDVHKTVVNSRRKDKRPYSFYRGYDYNWQKARVKFLKRFPFCMNCGEKAEVVDHIIPHRGNKDLFWDQRNWQPLCQKCHRVKTGKGQ